MQREDAPAKRKPDERVNDNQEVWQKGVNFLAGHHRRKLEQTRADLKKLSDDDDDVVA